MKDPNYEKYLVYKKIPVDDRFWHMMKRFDELEDLLKKENKDDKSK